MSLTRAVDTDPSRRALAKGLIAFAHEIGSTITAEGVETETEFATLCDLGVDKVQGFFLSEPNALEAAMVGESEPPVAIREAG
jgi:EAL domain-containing protein (putative c-di-GMP-specific phosphodiesterase class I)